ncbi:uncharacterized protein LOC131331936 [Rhododendron vialii]|uniref:uncharacterized protein LOC131331936 n=1 Tax=Rhododendron vialii TaxID=182163 RepID=UPI00265E8C44|nr:uncharacterized protein LOC131331936 [Rhododendron vialii]
MEINFENEFIEAGKSCLPQRKRQHFYEKMKRAAVSVHVVKADRIRDGNKFEKLEDADMGSGFIITKDGHIMTCSHLVQGVIKDGRLLFIANAEEPDVLREATVLYDEPGSDVAVLQLKKVDREFDFCMFGRKENISMGMEVFSISNPLGLEFSFLMGQVSLSSLAAGDIQIQAAKFDDDLHLIQLNNVNILSGASGGPLFDGKGRVIGMCSFGIGDTGYAVHIDLKPDDNAMQENFTRRRYFVGKLWDFCMDPYVLSMVASIS